MSAANHNPGGDESRTLIDDLLAEQRELTAVEKFSRAHDSLGDRSRLYRDLIPLSKPQPGQQYAFEVDLDRCTGCKACVSACHSLNGLDDDEVWRGVGMLVGDSRTAEKAEREKRRRGAEEKIPFSPFPHFSSAAPGFQQHITTACHHCVDPACLNGCPVLAYDKDPLTGIVRHLDDQCIGCQYCVMKCPYEVPQYSKARGIVRKCDMCHSRLAVGEAPACVQACPTSAIKITVVEQARVRGKFRGLNSESRNPKSERSPKSEYPNSIFGFRLSFGSRISDFGFNSFLPASPNPAITLPTTRYVTQRTIPANVFAGDHAAVKRADSHLPLVILLVLSQLAIGASVAALVVKPALPLLLGALVVGVVAMIAGSLHLGQPLKAWRSFLGWRKSWFSREVIAFGGFVGILSMAVALHMFDLNGRSAAVSSSTSRSTDEKSDGTGLLKPSRHSEPLRLVPATQPRSGEGAGSGVVSGSEQPSPLNHNPTLNLNPPSGSEEIKSKITITIKNPEAAGSGFTHMVKTMLIIFAALAGLSTVVCSAMIYVDTRREFWNATRSFTKFFGTTLLLGLAAAFVVMVLNSGEHPSPLNHNLTLNLNPPSVPEGIKSKIMIKIKNPETPVPLQLAAALLALVTIAKLFFEQRIFVHLVEAATPSQTPLNKTARLLAGELNGFVRARIALALLGGVVLPLIALLQLAAGGAPSLLLAAVLLMLCVAGELIERHLFFTAVVTQKMPGALAE